MNKRTYATSDVELFEKAEALQEIITWLGAFPMATWEDVAINFQEDFEDETLYGLSRILTGTLQQGRDLFHWNTVDVKEWEAEYHKEVEEMTRFIVDENIGSFALFLSAVAEQNRLEWLAALVEDDCFAFWRFAEENLFDGRKL